MERPPYASVLGLGFGDCGKGRFIDHLARRWQARVIVRFNGGPQAGHNVVEMPEIGAPRHHTFAQFGSAMFLKDTRTVLLDPMLVDPVAFLSEASQLGRVGVGDAIPRTTIDGACRVITPYHRAAGRLREIARGAARHGSCGAGVGETVRHSLLRPDLTLRYRDLFPIDGARRVALREHLARIRADLWEDLAGQSPDPEALKCLPDAAAFHIDDLPADWINLANSVARACPPAREDMLHDLLTEGGTVLFEGAQGILLDEWRGFHPHTTWSSTGTRSVEAAIGRLGIHTRVCHLGAMRAYPTRHGEGPFPTEDPTLNPFLPEPHNSGQGWQGAFRRGHPDAVLLGYALESIGPLDGLLVSHLDVFDRDVPLKWCESYEIPVAGGAPERIRRLDLSPSPDLDHQEGLARLLQSAVPCYACGRIQSEGHFTTLLRSVSGLPIVAKSSGPADGSFGE